MAANNQPTVSVGSLGGTITMVQQAGAMGISPDLTAEALLADIPALNEVATIRATTLSTVPGASLTPADILETVDWAAEQIRAGADGVVIAQGTDTIEETAYFASLYWEQNAPLVFTGAMKAPTQPSSDTAANLIAACRAASTGEFNHYDPLVVLNNEIHSAIDVRKEHSTSLNAFESAEKGPVGAVIEGNVFTYRSPKPTAKLSRPNAERFVPLLETFLGDDGTALRALRETGADGAVIAAFGVGHVSMALADEIERTAVEIPVIVSSRTSAGGTLTATYGFSGSEIDLARRGAVLSGPLDPRKSRMLLMGLLETGANRTEIVTTVSNCADTLR